MKTYKQFCEDAGAVVGGGTAPTNSVANIAGTGNINVGIDKALPHTNQAEPGVLKKKKLKTPLFTR